MKNFWFLFAAYTIIWTAMFAYIIILSKKNKALREDLSDLRVQVQQHLPGSETT
jgi:CcmD family protein